MVRNKQSFYPALLPPQHRAAGAEERGCALGKLCLEFAGRLDFLWGGFVAIRGVL